MVVFLIPLLEQRQEADIEGRLKEELRVELSFRQAKEGHPLEVVLGGVQYHPVSLLCILGRSEQALKRFPQKSKKKQLVLDTEEVSSKIILQL